MRVEWLHDGADDPIVLYSEITNEWETRKVDVFRDGRMEYASQKIGMGTTFLGLAAIPPIAEIEEDSAFLPALISADRFEEIWYLATHKSISDPRRSAVEVNPRY